MSKVPLVCWVVGFVGLIATAEAGEVDLGKLVVTPGRWAQAERYASSDVSIISEEDIRDSAARTVSEILKEELGVNVYDNSTDKTATVDIRGFGDTAARNVLILVNGRKINTIDVSGPDIFQIPLSSVERIEIIRGGGSVLYGDNATGGVVNIITKQGKGKPSLRTTSTYGSYNTMSEDLEISGSQKLVDYYFYSRYFEQDGYRANSELLAKDYNARVGVEPNEHWKSSVLVGWHEDDYGLPGGLNDTELRTLGRRGSASLKDFASSKDQKY